MVDSTFLIPDGKDDEEKQGHKVLCCCDSRKAVLIFNSITLVVVIAFFINGAMIRQLGARTILKFIADVVVGIAVIVSALTFGLRGVTAGISLAVIEIIWLTVDVAMGKVSLQDPEEAAGSIAYVVIIYLLRLLILYMQTQFTYTRNVRASWQRRLILGRSTRGKMIILLGTA